MYDYIIVEGVDGVGKTTLCDKIRSLGYHYLHNSYDPDCMDVRHKYLFDVFNTDDKKIVFDRSFISEYCYGNVYREKSRISFDECIELMDHYKQKNTLLIYVESNRSDALKRRADDNNLELYWDALLSTYHKMVNEAFRHMDVYVIHGA